MVPFEPLIWYGKYLFLNNYNFILFNLSYRYRNFKTFVSPRPVQFSCVSIDSTGEFVAAGGQDVFEAYLWSMKIGKLLEVRTRVLKRILTSIIYLMVHS